MNWLNHVVWFVKNSYLTQISNNSKHNMCTCIENEQTNPHNISASCRQECYRMVLTLGTKSLYASIMVSIGSDAIRVSK